MGGTRDRSVTKRSQLQQAQIGQKQHCQTENAVSDRLAHVAPDGTNPTESVGATVGDSFVARTRVRGLQRSDQGIASVVTTSPTSVSSACTGSVTSNEKSIETK